MYYITNQDASIELDGISGRIHNLPRYKVINQSNVSSILSEALDSNYQYFIDGIVDLTGLGVSINIPSTGLSIVGFGFDSSQLKCSDDDYVMISSDTAGTTQIKGVAFYVTGTNSQLFDLTANNSFDAVELLDCNFYDCKSLGEISGFRQYLEFNIARFGGTPEITFTGSMNGARITTSIVRSLDDITALFKAGDGLVFSGRFITDINCDLPTNGALLDFSPSNFTNDESFILKGCYITRDGVLDSSDENVFTNIDQDSVKSLWSDNTGIPNTNKYIKSYISTEITTTISVIDTYYPLLGTHTVEFESHFDMPVNGQFRLLSGNGTYQVISELILVGTANDEVDIRVVKSIDGGSTFPTEISHIKRVINNLSGGRDVAFFQINFITTMKKNDRLRFEVENKSGTGDVSIEVDSFVIITHV